MIAKFTSFVLGIYGPMCSEMFPFTVNFKFVVYAPDPFLIVCDLEMQQSKCEYSTTSVVPKINRVVLGKMRDIVVVCNSKKTLMFD